MFAFASPVPAAFAGLDALQPRAAPRQSTEEQYFRTLAEEHERAAAFARQRLQETRLRQQQHDLEAKLRLQQQLAASLQARTPMRSPYQPRATLDRALPDIIFEFGTEEPEAYGDYAERMHHHGQGVMLERQKRAEEQAILRALFEEQRRTQAEHVAELHRKRAEEAKVERERIIRAQRERAQLAEREQARRHLAARAAEEEKLKSFFEALLSAMSTEKEEGADLMVQAMRRNTVPTPAPVQTPTPTRAPASAPNFPTPAPRAASPTPSVASDSSDASLHSIAHLQDKYNSLRSSFTFPSTLAFAPTTNNSPASAPTLLFNPINAPIHAYEHALTGLLTELDAVESFGDDHVRDVRRGLVRRVEAELEGLEERKREMWRQSVGEVEVPVAVESVPAPVESLEVPVESAPASIAAESTPAAVESTPVPALPTTIDPANPLAWLAARLAQSSESEDSEVEVVREGLAARLASESAAVESEPESVTVEVSEPATVESSEPVAVESSESLAVKQPEPAAAEQSETVTAEQSENLTVNEPEDLALDSSELTVTPRSTESSPSIAAESQPEPEHEHEVVETTEAEPIAIEVETVTETHTSTELASSSPAPVSEPEKLAEPEQLANTTEPEQLADIAEPEQLADITEPEVDSHTTSTSTAPESVISESESEPEILTVPEPTKFVQVFPDSDSEVDTDVDADLVSELADRKSTSGADEFEML